VAGHAGYVKVEYSGRVSRELGEYLEGMGFRAVRARPLVLPAERPGELVGRILRFLADTRMGVSRVLVSSNPNGCRPRRDDRRSAAAMW